MDFCDNETIRANFQVKNLDGKDMQILLYKIFVPILLIGCVFSLLLNAVLVAVGSASRNTMRTRSPILVLSLNLAATDCLASFLIGLSFVINSFLPVVLNVHIEGPKKSCFLLILEVFRLSSLIASAAHLLAMALVHYKGIVNPLHYRSVIFCSQHRTRSIYLMTFICWFVPAVLLATYFSSIPCQGFQSISCRVEFIATFRFRAIMLVAFFIPLICMSVLYIRIFIIIKQHQAARACQRQQSCQISIRSRSMYVSSSSGTPSLKPSSLLMSSHSIQADTTLPNSKSSVDSNDSATPIDCKLSADAVAQKDACESAISTLTKQQSRFKPSLNSEQKQAHFNAMMVTSNPRERLTKTILYRQQTDTEPNADEESPKKRHCFRQLCRTCCHHRLVSQNSSFHSQSSSSESATSIYCKDGFNKTTKINHSVHKQRTCPNMSCDSPQLDSNPKIRPSPVTPIRNRLGQSPGNFSSYDQPIGNTGHTKALVTTLLILGTYLLCYMPAVIFFALTCVDHCPFPITHMDWRLRIVIAFITNGLVVLKAIVDPLIYAYRLKEMKSALNRCFSYLCPSFVMALCPPSYDGTSSMRYSQQNSFSRSSMSYRGQFSVEPRAPLDTVRRQPSLCHWSNQTTSSWRFAEQPETTTHGSLRAVLLRRNVSTDTTAAIQPNGGSDTHQCKSTADQYELKQLCLQENKEIMESRQ